MALEVQAEGQGVAPSVMRGSRVSIRDILGQYRRANITRLVALRGDLPSGLARPASSATPAAGGLHSRAIRRQFPHRSGCYPEYHPQARSVQEDLQNFKRKIDAGASAHLANTSSTQMPTSRSWTNAKPSVSTCRSRPASPINRFATGAFLGRLRCRDPALDPAQLEGFGDDVASIRSFGLDVVTALCDRLLRGGAPGLHFYTLNQAGPTTTWRRLGL